MDKVEDGVMGETDTNSAATAQNRTPFEIFLNLAESWNGQHFLDCLTTPEVLAFSLTCKAAERMSGNPHKEQLLTAVVCGDENSARTILTSRPELLLDKSTTVTDLSGKEIKNLNPLQAAMCAGMDTDMLQVMKDVLYQKLRQDGKVIGCKNKRELDNLIRCQFKEIYPNGIDAVEAEQMAQAQQFKASTLQALLAAINTATNEQVQYELDTPGQHNPGRNNQASALNTALHDFREQFTKTSHSEQIFNPYYLLEAFKFYDERFANFQGNDNDQWNRRLIFWHQVIGYTQRHLPACLLQAFAQGIYDIVEGGEKLKRDFEFKYDRGFYMRANTGDLNNLGYKYAGRACWGCVRPMPPRPCAGRAAGRAFKNYCEQKNQVWRTYLRSHTGNESGSTCRLSLA